MISSSNLSSSLYSPGSVKRLFARVGQVICTDSPLGNAYHFLGLSPFPTVNIQAKETSPLTKSSYRWKFGLTVLSLRFSPLKLTKTLSSSEKVNSLGDTCNSTLSIPSAFLVCPFASVVKPMVKSSNSSILMDFFIQIL